MDLVRLVLVFDYLFLSELWPLAAALAIVLSFAFRYIIRCMRRASRSSDNWFAVGLALTAVIAIPALLTLTGQLRM